MGSRGAFLESGGFNVPAQWQTVNYVDGIKVLRPKDPKVSLSLPERSNTPGTSYLLYSDSGVFRQLRVFGEDRNPVFDIDYGTHQGRVSLHIHYYSKGKRAAGNCVVVLKKGDVVYEHYKHYFKGVE